MILLAVRETILLKMMRIVLIIALLATCAFAFRPVSRKLSRGSSLQLSPPAADFSAPMTGLTSLMTALEEAKPDDYVYGAVNAPDFVLPLAAFGVVALAAIPFLLAPGEEALEEQRRNEAEKGAEFNRRKDKDLR